MYEGFRFPPFAVCYAAKSTVVIDPIDYDMDDGDVDELAVALTSQGFKVLPEYFEDDQGARWGLRVVDARLI